MAIKALARGLGIAKAVRPRNTTSGFSGDYDVLTKQLRVYFPDGSQLLYHDIPMEIGIDFENNPTGTKYNTLIKHQWY